MISTYGQMQWLVKQKKQKHKQKKRLLKFCFCRRWSDFKKTESTIRLKHAEHFFYTQHFFFLFFSGLNRNMNVIVTPNLFMAYTASGKKTPDTGIIIRSSYRPRSGSECSGETAYCVVWCHGVGMLRSWWRNGVMLWHVDAVIPQ